jgi:hypothetical protein
VLGALDSWLRARGAADGTLGRASGWRRRGGARVGYRHQADAVVRVSSDDGLGGVDAMGSTVSPDASGHSSPSAPRHSQRHVLATPVHDAARTSDFSRYGEDHHASMLDGRLRGIVGRAQMPSA